MSQQSINSSVGYAVRTSQMGSWPQHRQSVVH